ncbi:MAG: EamA family transporter [Candidatus Thorarchaeota archaeon]
MVAIGTGSSLKTAAVQNLALHILDPTSTLTAQDLSCQDYVSRMISDIDRARRFTRMLYEIHQSLADSIADLLDMSGVERMMDSVFWVNVIYVGEGVTFLGFFFYFLGIRNIGATNASVFNNLIPVFGVLLSVLVLSKTVYSTSIIGLVLVFMGVSIMIYSAKDLESNIDVSTQKGNEFSRLKVPEDCYDDR